MQMHPGQLPVPLEAVRSLVDQQFPQWQAMPISEVDSQGTVNALFRIGDEFVARFPLVPGDVEATRRTLESEAQAARELSGCTRFPTPEPVALGEPGAGYPLPWSVQTWLSGTVATAEDPGGSVPFALNLAEFIRGVRTIDTRGRAFDGRGRGGDLRSSDAWMAECFGRSEDFLDVPRLRRLWAVMRELTRTAGDVMTHGDLIPGNVLVSEGRLAAVIDVGGLGPADPALDLVGAWHLLEAGPRQVFREDLGCDDLEWERGRAWAFEQSMGAAWYYAETNPAMSLMGRRTLQRIVADTWSDTVGNRKVAEVDDRTSGQPSIRLRPLGVSDEAQALKAQEELAHEGFEFLFELEQGVAWPAYCERVESQRLGLDLAEGRVPATFLVAEADGQVVGRVSIRHELNAFLRAEGGHIGYGVRPGFRRRGYATAIMRQSLAVASSIGLERVLVTCDDDNVGSAKVIERCGGVLENVVAGRDGSVPKRRYWVEIGEPR